MTESTAILQSRLRLKKAEQALERLESASEYNEMESAWSDLLLAGNAVFSKLEQGSKLNGKASAWFGSQKRVRKRDPLLSYMHHARNADEHGIEEITQRMLPGQATLTIREPFDPMKLDGVKIELQTDALGHVIAKSSNEAVISTRSFKEATVALVRVNDKRYGDYFDPPFEHLGCPLADNSITSVGRAFVEYLRSMITEALNNGV